jgi:hypothetical protein
LIINKKIDKTELIEKIEQEYKIGQKVRLLNNKELFDKLKTKYDDKVYTIVKVNKNTLDIEDDKQLIKNVKKYNVKIITAYIKKEPEIKDKPTRKQVEKEYQTELLHKRIDIQPENIVEGKRVRKANTRYN